MQAFQGNYGLVLTDVYKVGQDKKKKTVVVDHSIELINAVLYG